MQLNEKYDYKIAINIDLNKDNYNNINEEIFEIIKYFDNELYIYTKELFICK